MKFEFWGVRGTAPVSGEDRNKYGGHTSCASLMLSDDDWIIIDAGTGLRKLGERLVGRKRKRPVNLHFLLTHFHLDHIIGLPFFTPLYSSTTNLRIYADCNPEETERLLSGLTAGRYFPVKFRETPSEKKFIKIPDEDFSIGKIRVSHCPLIHPQGSLSYKFHVNGKSIVFATDTEHPEKGLDQRLVSFVRGVDILIYDATFTPEEYKSGKKGWGHSSWLEGTKVAREAGVENLYLSHFNPGHSDKQIDEIISLAREKFPRSFGAREGVLQIF